MQHGWFKLKEGMMPDRTCISRDPNLAFLPNQPCMVSLKKGCIGTVMYLSKVANQPLADHSLSNKTISFPVLNFTRGKTSWRSYSLNFIWIQSHTKIAHDNLTLVETLATVLDFSWNFLLVHQSCCNFICGIKSDKAETMQCLEGIVF